jgi:tetratricopeptide (TPR) repeat protein
LAFIGVLAMIFAACATMGGGGEGLSLAEAIEQSAEKIAADLPAGSRVAIVAWESPSAGLSDYLMEELTGALVDRRLEVADRQNLEYVYRELDFQMSGDVSDESARSIGKFLGADLVITGQLTELGGPYRCRTNAIHVETATRDSATRLDVRGDAATRRMVRALAGQKPVAKTTSYGEGGNAAPKTAGAFLDRGILFASRGEWEMAVEDFTEAIGLNPNLSAAYLLRGRASYATVSRVRSIGENFSSVSVDANIMWQWQYGDEGIEGRQAYDRAIADFTQAIKLDPKNVQAYTYRGYVSENLADFAQAIRLDPKNVEVYYARGSLYWRRWDYARAIPDLTQAIKLDPNNAVIYIMRGTAYSMKDDHDRAIADYTQAIRIDPNYAQTYNYRGEAYYNKGDYDRAIADFEAALRINPNYQNVVKNNLENARRARGR